MVKWGSVIQLSLILYIFENAIIKQWGKKSSEGDETSILVVLYCYLIKWPKE